MKFYKRIVYNCIIPIIGYCFRKRNKYLNVIYYHDVVDGEGYSFMETNFELFKSQMEYIARKGYTTIRFDDLKSDEDILYNPKKILIVFDDGLKSNYTKIYELMKRLQLKYNIYLVLDRIGNDKDFLTWEQVCKMHDEGFVGFGTHTFTHQDVSDIDKVNVETEFYKADNLFEKYLGYKPLDFCYPFGKYSDKSNEYIASNLSYKRIYTSEMMYSYSHNNTIIFGRNAISNDKNFFLFKAKIKGYFNIWKSLFG